MTKTRTPEATTSLFRISPNWPKQCHAAQERGRRPIELRTFVAFFTTVMSTPSQTSNYRPDIDGLRAIAVLAVVFFHANKRVLTGGFVGVDLFFVISGYLITAVVLPKMKTGQFSLSTYYEHRIRRLLPALTVLLGCCTAAACSLYYRDELREFAQSLLASFFFVSNFFFLSKTNYFDVPESMPLLHTWSLAVEEQFYILYPLFLWLLVRFAKNRVLISLVAAFAVSFAANAIAVEVYPSATFYLFPTRAWEILLGALVYLTKDRIPVSRRGGEAFSLVGAALTVYSVVAFSSATPFPGIAALVPCLGAASLIVAGHAPKKPLFNQFLEMKPLVFVGLISYSLYLWHWPLFVYFETLTARAPTVPESLLVIIISFAAAAISWRFVEQPFRGKRAWLSRKGLFTTAGFTAFGAAASGLGLILTPWPLSAPLTPGSKPEVASTTTVSGKSIAATAAGIEVERPLKGCLKKPLDQPCYLGAKGSGEPPKFLLWGDSHAEMMQVPLDVLGKRWGVKGRAVGQGGCPPLLGVERADRPGCKARNEETLPLIQTMNDLELVILVARWGINAIGKRLKNEPRPPAYLVDERSSERSFAETKKAFRRGMSRTIKTLNQIGLEVIIMAQTPPMGVKPKDLERLAALGRKWTGKLPKRADYFERQETVLKSWAHFEEAGKVHVVYPHKLLCPKDQCHNRKEGVYLYRDDDHLSQTGALYVATLFEPEFRRLFGSEPAVAH